MVLEIAGNYRGKTMGCYSYVVLARAQQGREAEFDRWYDERHLDDVTRIPGVVAARRFKVIHQQVTNLNAPQWHSLAIYEIEADDPQSVLSAISAASGTEIMPITDALNRDGLLQVIGEPVSSRRTADE
jgi:hypothetical protein